MVTTNHIHNSLLVTDPDLSARHYTTNYTEDFTEDDSYLSVMTADFTTFLQWVIVVSDFIMPRFNGIFNMKYLMTSNPYILSNTHKMRMAMISHV